MLSGIGPASHLREHGIAMVADAPRVGAGLQDHPWCLVLWRTPDSPTLLEEITPENLEQWRREGRGPMASNGVEAGGFARSRDGLPAPDLQYGVRPVPDPTARERTARVFSQLVWALEVASRGRVSLRSADPLAKPLIDPAYLADDADLEVLAAGARQAREIAAQAPLARHITAEDAPGEQVRDDDALRAWIRRNVGTIFHPTSTCAMGSGAEAVCDSELRVRGVDGLRVVDASVMPAVPRGNTNAPTIAIAERAADLIRDERPLAPADPSAERVTASQP